MSDALDSPYYGLIRAALERSTPADEPVLTFHWQQREVYMELNGESFEIDADAFLALVEQVAPAWWPRYRQSAVAHITAASNATLPAVVPIVPALPEPGE